MAWLRMLKFTLSFWLSWLQFLKKTFCIFSRARKKGKKQEGGSNVSLWLDSETSVFSLCLHTPSAVSPSWEAAKHMRFLFSPQQTHNTCAQKSSSVSHQTQLPATMDNHCKTCDRGRGPRPESFWFHPSFRRDPSRVRGGANVTFEAHGNRDGECF